VTPAERRERELARIEQAGWDDGANDPPLTESQIERIALLIAPAFAALPRPRQADPLRAAA
jgi:hypothetical protein